MKVILDQNLSPKLCERLNPEFSAIHVRDLGLESAGDFEIWEYATKNGYSIISKDQDFNSLSQVKGFPPHVIWIRMGNCSTNEVFEMLKTNSSAILQVIKDGEAGIIELY